MSRMMFALLSMVLVMMSDDHPRRTVEGVVTHIISVSFDADTEPYGPFQEPTGPALPDGAPDALQIVVDGVVWDSHGAVLSIPGKTNATPEDVFWWTWRWDREKMFYTYVTMEVSGERVVNAYFDVKLITPVVINHWDGQKPGKEPSKSRGER